MLATLDEKHNSTVLASKGIQWKLHYETRARERLLVGAIVLGKVLGKALLTFTELNMLLIKIEGVINSRRLTAISDDHRVQLPITPAQFAIGRQTTQSLT